MKQTALQKINQKNYRNRHPFKYAYTSLKHNTKRRGHEFNLTLSEFIRFCRITSYLKYKGIRKNNYTIDRIDETKGYTLDNMQVLSNSDNVKKQRDLEKNQCPF
jgi:hypothetical protein